MIGKIISGSPCLESMELKDCHGYRRIDVTSKSVKKLVLFEYYCGVESEEDSLYCIKFNCSFTYRHNINVGVDFATRGIACGILNVLFCICSSASKISVTMYERPKQEIEVHFRDPKQYEDYQVTVM
ncbi:hypothetical protein Tco_0671665, partial [Tanacetum coccineum]